MEIMVEGTEVEEMVVGRMDMVHNNQPYNAHTVQFFARPASSKVEGCMNPSAVQAATTMMSNELQQVEEQKVYNPWNLANRRISDAEILRILRAYGIKDRPQRWELFRQACVHSSYVERAEPPTSPTGEPVIIAPRPEECMPLCQSDNEQIEFVGDSLLGCIIALYLHERYPDQDEGFLTRLRTRLVNNKQLGELAYKIGFHNWIILSRHVEDVCNGRRNLRILGSMLEAWVGAMYLDIAEKNPGAAFIRVRTWLITLFETHIDFAALIAEDNNFKDQLLKYYQATYHTPPKYKEVHVEGPLHDRTFTMGVLSPTGDIVATAVARNKKVAEQEASRRALIKLGALPADEDATH
jgi:ribonuclease-3